MLRLYCCDYSAFADCMKMDCKIVHRGLHSLNQTKHLQTNINFGRMRINTQLQTMLTTLVVECEFSKNAEEGIDSCLKKTYCTVQFLVPLAHFLYLPLSHI